MTEHTALVTARRIYRARRRRDKLLGTELFADPAWDILLDLFIQSESGQSVSVNSACFGSCVPPTTAHRWLTALCDAGMLVKHPDPQDRRLIYVSIVPSVREKMLAYFAGDDVVAAAESVDSHRDMGAG